MKQNDIRKSITCTWLWCVAFPYNHGK